MARKQNIYKIDPAQFDYSQLTGAIRNGNIYLHNSLQNFQAVSKQIARVDNSLITQSIGILERQRKTTANQWTEFLSAVNQPENEVLNILSKQYENPTQYFGKGGLFDQTVDNVFSAASDLSVETIMDEAIKSLSTDTLGTQGAKNRIEKALKDIDDTTIIKTTHSMAIVRNAILDAMAQLGNISRSDLQAVFAGRARTSELLTALINFNKGKTDVATFQNILGDGAAFKQQVLKLNGPLIKSIKGILGEKIAGEALSEALSTLSENLTLTATGAQKFQGKTVKRDYTIGFTTPDNIERTLGVSVKAMSTYGEGSKAAANFSIETGTSAADLVGKMKAYHFSGDTLNIFQYLVVNYATQVGKSVSPGSMPDAQKFILYLINAYSGIWFGLATTDNIKEHESMDNAILYDATTKRAIPIYRLLDEIINTIKDAKSIGYQGANQTYITFSNAPQKAQMKNIEKAKRVAAGEDTDKKIDYDTNILAVGHTAGSIALQQIQYHITANFLKTTLEALSK